MSGGGGRTNTRSNAQISCFYKTKLFETLKKDSHIVPLIHYI